MSRRTRTILPSAEKLLKTEIPKDVKQQKQQKQQKQASYYNKNTKDLPKLKSGGTGRIEPLKYQKE